MDRIAAPDLAAVILAAPAWARLGLAVREEHLRQRAADAVATRLLRLLNPPALPHPDQLNFPL